MKSALADFYPGYFALVMATGILSIDADMLSMRETALGLLALNVGFYAVLWIVTLARLLLFPRRVAADLADHAKGPGFLTIVAATNIIGSQLQSEIEWARLAAGLWVLGIVLWGVLLYSFLIAATVKEEKPSLEEGINGGWLLLVVATQSIAVLGCSIGHILGQEAGWVYFPSFCAFLVGLALYALVTPIVFFRWLFVRMTPTELTPPYWINMGSLAISTLAGTSLVRTAARWDFLVDIDSFLKGATLLCWSAASWWLPSLFALGVWRHLWKRIPLAYDPQYWGMVFPLGMYSACTLQIAKTFGVGGLAWLAYLFFGLASIAWTATFLGLARRVVRRLFRTHS
jgi:tellurite resistance protein TehA-like permease